MDPSCQAIDLHVGERLRALRNERRISQPEVAARLGLSFQQVQKYERGVNRISASKLYQLASMLEVPIGDFFEGLPSAGAARIGDAPPGSARHEVTERMRAMPVERQEDVRQIVRLLCR